MTISLLVFKSVRLRIPRSLRIQSCSDEPNHTKMARTNDVDAATATAKLKSKRARAIVDAAYTGKNAIRAVC